MKLQRRTEEEVEQPLAGGHDSASELSNILLPHVAPICLHFILTLEVAAIVAYSEGDQSTKLTMRTQGKLRNHAKGNMPGICGVVERCAVSMALHASLHLPHVSSTILPSQ